MEPRDVARRLEHKMGEYRPVVPDVRLRLLRTDAYLSAARADPSVRAHLELGWYQQFPDDFHEPVLADTAAGVVTVCPPMMARLVDHEPVRIQQAFVDGAFLRRLFRFLVPGTGWEADEQIRAIMARHFSFELVAVEAVESSLGAA